MYSFWVKPGSFQHFWWTLAETLTLQGATMQVNHNQRNQMKKTSLKKYIYKECGQAAPETPLFEFFCWVDCVRNFMVNDRTPTVAGHFWLQKEYKCFKKSSSVGIVQSKSESCFLIQISPYFLQFNFVLAWKVICVACLNSLQWGRTGELEHFSLVLLLNSMCRKSSYKLHNMGVAYNDRWDTQELRFFM